MEKPVPAWLSGGPMVVLVVAIFAVAIAAVSALVESTGDEFVEGQRATRAAQRLGLGLKFFPC
jgi:hypothetical protein